MNYNKTVNFEKVKAPTMRRSVIDQLFKNDLTAELGKMIPVLNMDITPGTNVNMKAMAQVRLITPFKVPNFDNLEASFYWFFTPYRITWCYYQQFIAGGVGLTSYGYNYKSGLPREWNVDIDGEGILPSIKVSCDKVTPGSIYDYMGVPVLPASERTSSNHITINNAMPFMAYNFIWNEYFRDENLEQLLNFYFNAASGYSIPDTTFSLNTVSKKRDVFTTSLIKPQKGNSIFVPLGNSAPVKSVDGSGNIIGDPLFSVGESTINNNQIGISADGSTGPKSWISYAGNAITGGTIGTADTDFGLIADLQNASGISISNLRLLVQCQRFQERLAQGGTRYGEILSAFFNTDPGDKSLQEPEFLGMASIDINTQEVIKTADSDFGSTGARSNSIDKAGNFMKAFTEFGLLSCYCVIRQKYNTYQQGLKPMLDYKGKLDFYWPTFSHISYQPVKNKFIYCEYDEKTGQRNEETFGFNEPYIFLKTMVNEVHGDMLSNAGTSTLDYWHYGDYYSSLPTLTSTWLKATDVNLKRALLIPSGQTAPVRPFAINFRAKARVTSLIPLNSDPGYLDHF